MKIFIIALIIICWLAGMYFAFIHIVGKTMQPSQADTGVHVNDRLQQDQAQKMQQVADQQRRLMEDRQRHLRNH